MKTGRAFKSFCRQQQWRMQGWCLRCTCTALWSPWWVHSSVIRSDVARNASNFVPKIKNFCAFGATLNGAQGNFHPSPTKSSQIVKSQPESTDKMGLPIGNHYQWRRCGNGALPFIHFWIRHLTAEITKVHSASPSLLTVDRLLSLRSMPLHSLVIMLSYDICLSMNLLQNMDIYGIIFPFDLTLAPKIRMW